MTSDAFFVNFEHNWYFYSTANIAEFEQINVGWA